MEILSQGERVILWQSTIEAQGTQRRAFLHAIASSVAESLGVLGLCGSEYAELVVESLELLDDADLFATDPIRFGLESLHHPGGGVDMFAADLASLLRDAAGIQHLDANRRVRAVELAAAWREHVIGRERPDPTYISVSDVAAKFGVTTQAVYKWLKDSRIDATRGPGGSWRIPTAQFDRDTRPAASRAALDNLKQHLIQVHQDQDLPAEYRLTSDVRSGR